MAKDTSNFKYTVNEEVDEIVDEKGNTAILFRKLAWGDGKEKLELRKWYVNIDGETPSKGVTFLTEEGPNNLVNVFVKKGFGETESVLNILKDREDFEEALTNVIGKKKVQSIKEQDSSGVVEYYDPKEMLG